MNELDVVDQKRLLEASHASPAALQASPAAPEVFGRGQYDVCDLAALPERTRTGWRVVRLVEQVRLETARRDVVAPSEIVARQLNEGPVRPFAHHSVDLTAAGIAAGVARVMPPPERGTVSLYEQVPVKVTVALIFLEEGSVLAATSAELNIAHAARVQAENSAFEAREEAKASLKAKEEAEKRLEGTLGRIAQMESEVTAWRDRGRRMEQDLSALRRDKEKLVEAVGKIRAAEVLGA